MTKILKYKNELNVGAPDGGWGWIVCIAAGLSLLLTFPLRKTFGLIFRENFENLGITSSEIATIINFHIAIATFQGVLYGPIYRILSFRQVALISAFFVVIGIFILAFAKTFISIVLSFSVIYGLGIGFNKSAALLTVNTYFDDLRPRAQSILLTLSAVGPMIMPPIVNALIQYYGVQGTVIIFSGLAMHAIAFALIYQPVKWHTKKVPTKIYVINVNSKTELSITSLNTLNTTTDEESGRYVANNTQTYYKKQEDNNNTKAINNLNTILCNELKIKLDSKLKDSDIEKLTCTTHKQIESNCSTGNQKSLKDNKISENGRHSKCFKKISVMFDFDLLCDYSYLNIIFGFALSTVSELNSSLLMPFILADFGLTNNQIALILSVVAFTDLVSRFSLPYLTNKIQLSSRIFYMIGIAGIALSRIAIAQNPEYHIHLILFSLMGTCTAMRSIFMNLILPEYLPLEKLPSGTGLQQIPSGLLAFVCGPVIGYLRDATNYSFVLYFLSSFPILTIILWTMEMVWKKLRTKVFKLN